MATAVPVLMKEEIIKNLIEVKFMNVSSRKDVLTLSVDDQSYRSCVILDNPLNDGITIYKANNNVYAII